MCAQKWADISDGNYGVSLLNNCKYGHSAEGSTLCLTLIKCATFPNPHADKGMHYFTYSLLPHEGDYRKGNTVQEAYLLNRPLEAISVKNQTGKLNENYSLIKCNRENVIIEAVKKAEDSEDLIIRLYDAYDITTDCELLFGFEVGKAYICDMLENNISALNVNNNKISITVKNFEIMTLKICRQ